MGNKLLTYLLITTVTCVQAAPDLAGTGPGAQLTWGITRWGIIKELS